MSWSSADGAFVIRHSRWLNSTRFEFLADSREVYQRWRRLLIEHDVKGVQVHDARLAASDDVRSASRRAEARRRGGSPDPTCAVVGSGGV